MAQLIPFPKRFSPPVVPTADGALARAVTACRRVHQLNRLLAIAGRLTVTPNLRVSAQQAEAARRRRRLFAANLSLGELAAWLDGALMFLSTDLPAGVRWPRRRFARLLLDAHRRLQDDAHAFSQEILGAQRPADLHADEFVAMSVHSRFSDTADALACASVCLERFAAEFRFRSRSSHGQIFNWSVS